ncbi:hypothetical protein ACLB2K_025312 [Fragaria x ananassa]
MIRLLQGTAKTSSANQSSREVFTISNKESKESLLGCNSSSVGVELAKAEISSLASMVNNGCPSTSFSELTEQELQPFKTLKGNTLEAQLVPWKVSSLLLKAQGRRKKSLIEH